MRTLNVGEGAKQQWPDTISGYHPVYLQLAANVLHMRKSKVAMESGESEH